MAIACGAAVANIYYAQPLLSTIAGRLHVSDGTAGLLVTASQVGYATGLVLLVPMGDLLERRRLITRIMLVTAAALACTAASPSLGVLAGALLGARILPGAKVKTLRWVFSVVIAVLAVQMITKGALHGF